MKNRVLHILILSQIMIVLLFLALTLFTEFIDMPHIVFGDAPTSYPQRLGEIGVELSVFAAVMVIQVVLFHTLYRRIRILEGFIPICANCKRIRDADNEWEQLEGYITRHSHSEFSHGLCPDCARELYPRLYKGNDRPETEGKNSEEANQ
jgi:hypothetical protein